ncbi:MAG: hypothetical protein L6275_01075, partial [Candidatus Portnoybacteria bacterium]|nr:hypothetical protein [Candidatus Portnoybacteria bacterium]
KMNTYIGAALSKTGPYAVYIQAIADALINRILTEGKGLLQADAVPSPEYGDIGESENLPEILSAEDNYTIEVSAEKLITNLQSLREATEDYLIPQQEDTLVAWNLAYNAYEDAIPFLETTMNECSGVIADNYTWASSTKAEIINNILPSIEEEINQLEKDILETNEAVSLISVAMFSVEDLIIGVREWEVLYEESYGLETASTTAAQDNIDIAKEIVIGDVQDILSVLDAVITSIDLNETATEIDDLSDEIYDALTEVLMLYSDLAGEIGDPTYPNSGTIYAELEKANGIIEEAKTRAIACIDERNRRAAAARDN